MTEPVQQRPFGFLRTNARPPKPRFRGMTEIRAAYYSVGGAAVPARRARHDGRVRGQPEFAGWSFTLMPERTLREILDVAHEHDVLVSTGGFVEYVLTQGRLRRTA